MPGPVASVFAPPAAPATRPGGVDAFVNAHRAQLGVGAVLAVVAVALWSRARARTAGDAAASPATPSSYIQPAPTADTVATDLIGQISPELEAMRRSIDDLMNNPTQPAPTTPAGSPAPPAPVTPTPASQPTVNTYTVVSRDTLYGIASRLLGDGNKWRSIYDANARQLGPLVGSGRNIRPTRLNPGMQLVIPR